MNSEPHLSTMELLDHLCDEATFVDWEQPGLALPDWQTSWRHLVADGKSATLTNPSVSNQARAFRLRSSRRPAFPERGGLARHRSSRAHSPSGPSTPRRRAFWSREALEVGDGTRCRRRDYRGIGAQQDGCGANR